MCIRDSHHIIRSSLPYEPHPKFIHLCIYGPGDEVSIHVNSIGATIAFGIKVDILHGLQKMLDMVNPYVAICRNTHDILQSSEQVPNLCIRIVQARMGRQHIKPIVNEVAALLAEGWIQKPINKGYHSAKK